jgi:hypothetical protein
LIALEKLTTDRDFGDNPLTSDELRKHNPLRKTPDLRKLEQTLSSINATLFLVRNTEGLKAIAAKAGCARPDFTSNAQIRRAIAATACETVAEAARKGDSIIEADVQYLQAYLNRVAHEIKQALQNTPATATIRTQNYTGSVA